MAGIFACSQKIWISFSHHFDLGPSRGPIRRSSVYLRDAGFLLDCVAHCYAVEHRNCGLSDGTCAALDAATACFTDPNAADDSHYYPWVIEDLRHRRPF